MKNKQLWMILVTILLVAILAIGLVACKDKNPTNSNNPNPDTPTDPSDPADPIDPSDPTDPITPTDPDDVSTSLGVPENLAINEMGKVSWKSVRNISGYEISVNDVIYTSRFNSFDVLSIQDLPANGQFSVSVRAVKDEEKGKWCTAVAFTYQGGALVTPSVSGLNGTMLAWTASDDAQYPLLSIGDSQMKLEKGTTSYDLQSITAKSDITLQYIGDGVYHKNSEIVRLAYDPADGSLAFAAPTNVYMEGDVLHFDKVVGATIYYFKDVYNTVTSLSGADINALQSDRKGKFLVQSIWAGTIDPLVKIEDSVETEVTYFTAAQGNGTQASPYMISNAGEMRYIEYYEAMNMAKYYQLKNDISFEPYSPANDEDYSNFYNLGSLSGTLDGNGHSLKNIVVYYKDGYSSIFDNITSGGKICNLKIEDTAWRTWTNRTNDGIMHEKGGECAILAYTNRGTIDNVTLVSGSVYAVKDGGAGLVAINRGTIQNCTVQSGMSIYGANEAGAFASYNAGVIQDCINYGAVSGKSSVGGIVGRNAGIVTRCGNEGTISGDINCGGIVGYNYNIKAGDTMQYDTKVSYCYNKGAITCTSYTGGIAGRNGSNGYNELSTKNDANATILGCYNQGVITGAVSVAGIAGQNFGFLDAQGNYGIRACYNSGDINYNIAGYKAGRLYLSVSNCSWAETDGPIITAYCWTKSGDNTTYQNAAYPGKAMKKTTLGSSTFYYIDLDVAPSSLTGVLFCRVNPQKYDESTQQFVNLDTRLSSESEGAGDIYNKTEDVADIGGTDSVIFYVDGNWASATQTQLCASAIAGYNNQVHDCYYKQTTIGGTTTQLTTVQTGNAINCTGYVETAQLRAIATPLNGVLGEEIFAAQENKFPVLNWQLAK